MVEHHLDRVSCAGSNPVRSMGNSSSGRMLCLEHSGPGSIPGFPIYFSFKEKYRCYSSVVERGSVDAFAWVRFPVAT